jgi:thymidylate synthase
MFEAFEYDFQCVINPNLQKLIEDCSPTLPWANEHFEERVSGIPYNPPPSHEIWGNGNTVNFTENGKFSHTYPERFWPKHANDSKSWNTGIRYKLGDLNDVVSLLYREQHTRQAYLPVWFPEDTGSVEGQRVPCSLGYLFRMVDGHLHITYKIRSCDIFRHFRDDVYLACRLNLWVLEKLKARAEFNHVMPDQWKNIKPGMLKMQIDSLHCFAIEAVKLRGE